MTGQDNKQCRWEGAAIVRAFRYEGKRKNGQSAKQTAKQMVSVLLAARAAYLVTELVALPACMPLLFVVAVGGPSALASGSPVKSRHGNRRGFGKSLMCTILASLFGGEPRQHTSLRHH